MNPDDARKGEKPDDRSTQRVEYDKGKPHDGPVGNSSIFDHVCVHTSVTFREPDELPLLESLALVAPEAGAVATGATEPEASELTALYAEVAAVRNGLSELLPLAFVRSKVKEFMELCCCRSADLSSLLMGAPSFPAQIQFVDKEEKSILPPVQVAQFEPVHIRGNGQPAASLAAVRGAEVVAGRERGDSQRTLAVITLLAMPEPSSRKTWL